MSKSRSVITLIHKLPAPTKIIQGSLVVYRTTCYRPGACHCHKGKKHGPYWYLSMRRGGKTKKVLIPKKKLPLIQRYLHNWRLYSHLIRQIMETNLELIKKEV